MPAKVAWPAPCRRAGGVFCFWKWLEFQQQPSSQKVCWHGGEQTSSPNRPFKIPRRDREGLACRISETSTDSLQGCVVTVYAFQLNKTNLADDCV